MNALQFASITTKLDTMQKQFEEHQKFDTGQFEMIEKALKQRAAEHTELRDWHLKLEGRIKDETDERGTMHRENTARLLKIQGFTERFEPYLERQFKADAASEAVKAWFARYLSSGRRIGAAVGAIILGVGGVAGAISYLLAHIH